jgi:hypothetical protein
MRPLICSKLVFSISLILLLAACGRPGGKTARKPGERLFTEAAPRARAADDAGRFLAGLPGKAGNTYKDLESEAAWVAHSRESDRLWEQVANRWVPAMGAFQKRELAGASIEESVVFYPFSGPDTLMMTTFFPRNRVYVMVGLEPTGTLPERRHVTAQNLESYLGEIREAVDSELRRSFFITREMDRQFRGQVTDGLISPILLLLTRSGHTVLGCRYVRLNEQGRIIDFSPSQVVKGRIGNRGLQVDFRTDADQSEHTLFYFSVNLSDDRLKQNQPFLTFLSTLKGMTTFFKATSYMPHHPGFSQIRERVLAGSGVILQDDSGLPYRFFDAARWQVQLYGDYERPYGSFIWLEQPNLRAAYHTLSPKPLGFRIGYGFSRIPSNLLLARRK